MTLPFAPICDVRCFAKHAFPSGIPRVHYVATDVLKTFPTAHPMRGSPISSNRCVARVVAPFLLGTAVEPRLGRHNFKVLAPVEASFPLLAWPHRSVDRREGGDAGNVYHRRAKGARVARHGGRRPGWAVVTHRARELLRRGRAVRPFRARRVRRGARVGAVGAGGARGAVGDVLGAGQRAEGAGGATAGNIYRMPSKKINVLNGNRIIISIVMRKYLQPPKSINC